MHDHYDQDHIMAMAEGRLAPDALAVAVAGAADCAQCQAALEEQRAALSFAADAPRARLTALESAGLRRRLTHELQLATAIEEAAPRGFGRRWILVTGLASAAAVLVAVVAIGPNLISFGGADASRDNVALEAPVATAADDLVARESAGVFEDSAAAAPAAPTEEASTEDADGAAGLELQRLPDDPDLGALREAFATTYLSGSSVGEGETVPQSFTVDTVEGTSPEQCIAAKAAASPYELETYVLGFSEVNGEPVFIIAYVETSFGDISTTVIAHDADDCAVVDQSGE